MRILQRLSGTAVDTVADNVLTTNKFPTETCKRVGLNSRRIGLGVTI